jgi:hypothetical protein
MLERLRRRRERYAWLQRADAIVWGFATVGVCVFGFVWLSLL